jgi:hypothetical protein
MEKLVSGVRKRRPNHDRSKEFGDFGFKVNFSLLPGPMAQLISLGSLTIVVVPTRRKMSPDFKLTPSSSAWGNTTVNSPLLLGLRVPERMTNQSFSKVFAIVPLFLNS